MKIKTNFILFTASIFCSSVFATDYPTRPIRLVVPFAAGSATDYVARTVANAASPLLGQSIVVENKVGADGVIAGADVAAKKPDGYNLFMAVSSPIAIAPALKKTLPYDPIREFSYITNLAHYSYMLYVNKSAPISNYKEFIEYAKSQPGKLNYGTGNMSNIAFNAQMKGQYELDMLGVPYKSESDALIGLMSGDIQSVWATVAVGASQVKGGRLKALVTASSQRSPLLPTIPTLAEEGAKPITVGGWATLAGPAGLPPEVVTKLNAAFTSALKQPDIVEKLAKGGFFAAPSTPAQTLEFVQQQTKEYLEILRAAGVKPE